MSVALFWLCLIAISYLLGSLCSAIIVCRLFHLPNPVTEGSKNPGTTNVLRIAGKKYAAIVLLGDLLKGTLPILLARMLGASDALIGFVGLSAVIGHIYPLYFQFKGGKGVATALGVILGINALLGVAVLVTWALVAKLSHYASLASIVAITLAPFYALFILPSNVWFLPLAMIALLIVYMHRENINRLFAGVEPKIKLQKNSG